MDDEARERTDDDAGDQERVCPSCGQRARASQRSCRRCGAPLDGAEPRPAPSLGQLIVGLGLAILLVVGAFKLLSWQQPDPGGLLDDPRRAGPPWAMVTVVGNPDWHWLLIEPRTIVDGVGHRPDVHIPARVLTVNGTLDLSRNSGGLRLYALTDEEWRALSAWREVRCAVPRSSDSAGPHQLKRYDVQMKCVPGPAADFTITSDQLPPDVAQILERTAR